MSHVSAVDLEIVDLECLEKAAEILGLELVRNQSTYRWWGKWVNDYHGTDAAYKNGVDPKDYGRCVHALRVKGNPNAYEVGLINRPDGRPGYLPVWDFFGSHGRALRDKIGKDGILLKQEYSLQVGMRDMARKGFRVERRVNQATQRPQMRAWR